VSRRQRDCYPQHNRTDYQAQQHLPFAGVLVLIATRSTSRKQMRWNARINSGSSRPHKTQTDQDPYTLETMNRPLADRSSISCIPLHRVYSTCSGPHPAHASHDLTTLFSVLTQKNRTGLFYPSNTPPVNPSKPSKKAYHLTLPSPGIASSKAQSRLPSGRYDDGRTLPSPIIALGV
jgi:hypothetical protein